MRRIVAVLLLASMLWGCSSTSAKFVRYQETNLRPSGAYGIDGEWNPNVGAYVGDPTGRAIVEVDGRQVAAECPYQGLEPQQRVEVKRNRDGSWVVVGIEQPVSEP